MQNHILNHIILASQSEARARLLQEANIPFEVRPTHLDETKFTHIKGDIRALERASAKMQFALNTYNVQGGALIIAADQTLTLEDIFFDKAKNKESARKQLTTLQGKAHQLHSAVAVGCVSSKGQAELFSFVETMPLQMKSLTPQEIDTYLNTERWRGAVGCYRIEERSHWFQSYPQDTSAIAGLPMKRFFQKLKDWNIVPPIQLPITVTDKPHNV